MERFTNFKDWKTGKSTKKAMQLETDESEPVKEKDDQKPLTPGNSELLALIEELAEKRNAASRSADGIGRQIYDLDIRVAKLEMQKNELMFKKKELEAAKSISETRKRSPRTNHG